MWSHCVWTAEIQISTWPSGGGAKGMGSAAAWRAARTHALAGFMGPIVPPKKRMGSSCDLGARDITAHAPPWRPCWCEAEIKVM